MPATPRLHPRRVLPYLMQSSTPQASILRREVASRTGQATDSLRASFPRSKNAKDHQGRLRSMRVPRGRWAGWRPDRDAPRHHVHLSRVLAEHAASAFSGCGRVAPHPLGRQPWYAFLGSPSCFPGDGKNTHCVCPEFLNLAKMGRRRIRSPPSGGLDCYFAILKWLRTDSTHLCIIVLCHVARLLVGIGAKHYTRDFR